MPQANWRGGGPVRQPTAALVISDIGVVLRQRLEPVRPDRASRVVLDMAQPMGSSQQGRAAPDRGHGNLGTVTRPAEPYLLIKPRHRSPNANDRQRVPGRRPYYPGHSQISISAHEHERAGRLPGRPAIADISEFASNTRRSVRDVAQARI